MKPRRFGRGFAALKSPVCIGKKVFPVTVKKVERP
jgi:hypothetical protein